MKLGVNVGLDRIDAAADAGFDYVECALSWLAQISEEEFQSWLAKAPSFRIPVIKCNGFMPGEIKPVGPDVDEAVLRAYLEKALSRAHAIGIRTAVFGSGAARRVPDGWTHKRAWQQLAEFLRLVEEYAAKYDITISIEPLRRQECNIVNLVSEATVLAAWVDCPHITVLGDTFHMLSCAEPWEAFTQAGSLLTHVHISHPLADMSSRDYPAPGDGQDYAAIVKVLKDMNYAGDISVEAGTQDFAKDGPVTAKYLKSFF